LSAHELRSRLAVTHVDNDAAACDALQRCLREMSESDILVRILQALRHRHQAASQWAEALAVQSQLVHLLPGARQPLLERAGLYERLECPRAAAADLQMCLHLDPKAPDAGSIRRRWARLRQQASRLH
jgi:regulator of sirC expression with transglutaminase-like and TPR domain